MLILNGNQTDLLRLIPPAPNVWVVHHENRCYDVGSYGEALQDIGEGLAPYKRFILMNASIRGPFVPHWSKECWSDAYLDKVTDKVKVRPTPFSENLSSPHAYMADLSSLE